LGWTIPLSLAAAPHIEDVRIGLRDGKDVARSRNGVWTPVQVTLKAGAEDVTQGSFRLAVETADGEAVPYVYTAPVPAIPANGERIVFAYVRPSSAGSSFDVKLQKADGETVETRAGLQRDPSSAKREVLEPREVFFLTIGSRLHGLKVASKPEAQAEDEDAPVPGFASIENVAAMPDRWFGYEAVDVIVLTTASDAFVNQLLEMDKKFGDARRDALFDWVRRGGRLVLSVGRNQQGVARWLEKVPLVDCAVKDKGTRSALPNVSFWCGHNAQEKKGLRNVEIARVTPGPNSYGLVWEDAGEGDLERRPVILQASCGLGRVVLVAFDLDAPPFSTWEGQAAFWKKLQGEIGPRPAAANVNRPAGASGQRGELGAELKQALESFGDVPVISFGWVALFILFYIVLVGPLDYLLLKKVFKRLELTWITFPILVLVVSVAAYATAYYFKGDDLRVNKIDLVEIDLGVPGQVYGTSWFTLFSPRIQNYTIGLEPAAPEWGGRWAEESADAPVPPMMVATLEGPEQSLGGNSQSVFRRPYEYAEDAGGIVRLPIPVWATRSFTASWRVPLKDRAGDRPPAIQAELRVSRLDPDSLTGAFTNNLPAELQSAVLFFHGKGYLLGDLVPGETREVGPLFERGGQSRTLQGWISDSEVLLPRPGAMPTGRQSDLSELKSYRALWPVLYHDGPGGTDQPNSGLRGFDASWRLLRQGEGVHLPFRNEAVLVARTPPRDDRAETVTQDGVSPSRLWLDQLPGTQAQRPALSGYLRQETYVRIYIPVQTQNTPNKP
jgi:hypothetical protein